MKELPEDLLEGLRGIHESRKNPLFIFSSTVSRGALLAVEDQLRGKHFDALDVLMHTPGGDADAAYLITKLFRSHASVVHFFVPLFAKSAGTLMCLGGDKIVLSELGELGPLDTQIREKQDGDDIEHKSALNGFKALEQIHGHTLQNLYTAIKVFEKETNLKQYDVMRLAIDYSSKIANCLYAQLDPKVIGEYARDLEVGTAYGIKILTEMRGWSAEDAATVVKKLVYNYPSHGFVIDHSELRQLGLPCDMMDEAITGSAKAVAMSLLKQESFVRLIEATEFTDGGRQVVITS